MLESIFEFICAHPIITLIGVFFILYFRFAGRENKRDYERSVDYNPGWVDRNKRRDYEGNKEASFVLFPLFIIVVIIVVKIVNAIS